MTLDEKLHQHIYNVLERTRFHRDTACEHLGISARTLRNYIHMMRTKSFKFPKSGVKIAIHIKTEKSNLITTVKYEYIFSILKKNHFNRVTASKELDTSCRNLQNQILQMQRLGWNIPAGLVGRRAGADRFEVKCFPTNEDRLKHLDSKKNF